MTTGYKKYMKKNSEKDFSAVRLFLCTFFGMLLVFIFLFKYFLPSADVSIGDNSSNNNDNIIENNAGVDGRLATIQAEDTNKSMFDIKNNESPINTQDNTLTENSSFDAQNFQSSMDSENATPLQKTQNATVYKVYVGSYTTLEQAKIAKDIITETNLNISPIIKCLGSNSYTLQIGIFKNKMSAEDLLNSLLKNHLPGRLIEES